MDLLSLSPWEDRSDDFCGLTKCVGGDNGPTDKDITHSKDYVDRAKGLPG